MISSETLRSRLCRSTLRGGTQSKNSCEPVRVLMAILAYSSGTVVSFAHERHAQPREAKEY